MEYILETRDLTKVYGQKEAARDVNLHIREGQIYGLIGRNGAGKGGITAIVISVLAVILAFAMAGTWSAAFQELHKTAVEFKPDGIWAQVSENTGNGVMGIVSNLPTDEASLNQLVDEMNELNKLKENK